MTPEGDEVYLNQLGLIMWKEDCPVPPKMTMYYAAAGAAIVGLSVIIFVLSCIRCCKKAHQQSTQVVYFGNEDTGRDMKEDDIELQKNRQEAQYAKENAPTDA